MSSGKHVYAQTICWPRSAPVPPLRQEGAHHDSQQFAAEDGRQSKTAQSSRAAALPSTCAAASHKTQREQFSHHATWRTVAHRGTGKAILTALSTSAPPAFEGTSWVLPFTRGLDFPGTVGASGLAFLARRGIGCAEWVREAAAGGAGVRRVTTMMVVDRKQVHQADYMRNCESRRLEYD